VPVLGEILRYAPITNGDTLLAKFETDDGPLDFIVEGEPEIRHLGNLLGNLQELREAKARMDLSGLEPTFVSAPREGAVEGVSAIYQLIRLKELLNQGLLGEMEFVLERSMMVQRFVEEGAPNTSALFPVSTYGPDLGLRFKQVLALVAVPKDRR